MSKVKYIKYGLGFLLIAAAMITLMGLVTMYLWNWLIPEIFSGKTITCIQAIGLIVLGKMLTGMMTWGPRNWRSHRHWTNKEHWKARMEAKLSNMTPEEKEQFKHYYYKRCGWKMHESVKEESPSA